MYEIRYGLECEKLATAELLSSMINPTAPCAYCFSYIGGWNREIRGSLEFFDCDRLDLSGVGNHLIKEANPHVYCVIRGKMANHQKTKVSEVASRDVKLLMDMLHWYVNESSIKGLFNITLPTECPTPIVMKDMDSLNRTDDKGYFWDYSKLAPALVGAG